MVILLCLLKKFSKQQKIQNPSYKQIKKIFIVPFIYVEIPHYNNLCSLKFDYPMTELRVLIDIFISRLNFQKNNYINSFKSKKKTKNNYCSVNNK